MTTTREIVEAALSDLLFTGVGETAAAADLSTGLRVLNQMIFSWQAQSVDVLYSTLALTDTFTFWVPPKSLDGAVIDAAFYAGTWDANNNTPALATGVGTTGKVYKVSNGGNTTLDGLTAWVVNDFLVFDGSTWLKGRSSAQHEQTIIAMLAVRLSSSYSVPVPDEIALTAQRGWNILQAQYVVAPIVAVDDALRRMPSSRYINGDVL